MILKSTFLSVAIVGSQGHTFVEIMNVDEPQLGYIIAE